MQGCFASSTVEGTPHPLGHQGDNIALSVLVQSLCPLLHCMGRGVRTQQGKKTSKDIMQGDDAAQLEPNLDAEWLEMLSSQWRNQETDD